MEVVRFRVALWFMLSLCLLLPEFLQGRVLVASHGNRPSTCDEVHCDKPYVTISTKEKQEGQQLIRSESTRSLRFTVVPTPERRILRANFDGTHPVRINERARARPPFSKPLRPGN